MPGVWGGMDVIGHEKEEMDESLVGVMSEGGAVDQLL